MWSQWAPRDQKAAKNTIILGNVIFWPKWQPIGPYISTFINTVKHVWTFGPNLLNFMLKKAVQNSQQQLFRYIRPIFWPFLTEFAYCDLKIEKLCDFAPESLRSKYRYWIQLTNSISCYCKVPQNRPFKCLPILRFIQYYIKFSGPEAKEKLDSESWNLTFCTHIDQPNGNQGVLV